MYTNHIMYTDEGNLNAIDKILFLKMHTNQKLLIKYSHVASGMKGMRLENSKENKQIQ